MSDDLQRANAEELKSHRLNTSGVDLNLKSDSVEPKLKFSEFLTSLLPIGRQKIVKQPIRAEGVEPGVVVSHGSGSPQVHLLHFDLPAGPVMSLPASFAV
ncbi:unnamed protein product [Ophioblennius macclurei]